MCVCVCVCCAVGHGLSEGDRIHIDTIETYARDVILHVERFKVKHPTLPVFLFGHSMVSYNTAHHPHFTLRRLRRYSVPCVKSGATHLCSATFHWRVFCLWCVTPVQTRRVLPSPPSSSQGGTIAAYTTVLRQDLFCGLILSGAALEASPEAAGFFLVSLNTAVLGV